MAKSKKNLFAPPTEDELKNDMFAPPTEEEITQPSQFPLSKEQMQAPLSIETFARGGLEAPSLGLSEPAISGANAVIGNMIDAGFDTDTIKDYLAKSTDIESIKKVYGEDVERRKKLKEDFSGADITGQVLGSLSPVGPAAALFKGAKAIGSLGKVGKEGLLKQGTRAAVTGGLFGAGATEAQNIVEETGGFIEPSQEMNPAGAGIIGAGLSAAPSVLKGVGKGVKALGKGALSAVTGVSPKLQTEALAKPQLLQGVAKPLEQIKQEVDSAVQQVQDKASVEKLNLTDDIISGVQDLKNKVSQGSGDAVELLTNRSDQLSLKPTKQAVNDAINSLKIMGQGPVGESAKGALLRLESLEKDLGSIGENITLDQAKKLIQQLDQDINYAQRAGQYSDAVDKAYSKVRKGIDSAIKELVPEYASKMKEVAQNTQLLKDVSKKFGDPQALYRKMDKLESDSNQLDRALLDRLGTSTGKNYSTYFDNLNEIYKPLGSLKPGSSENAIKSLIKGNSIENRKMFEKLGQVSDQDFVGMVDQLRMQEAFDKPFQIGSRNVNLWTVIGAMSGGASGDFTLAAPGAALGAVIDRYGPAMAKKILIGVSKIEGMPTIKKIQNLELPENVKTYLSDSLLKASLVGYRTGAPIKVPTESVASMEQDIIDSDSMSYTEKAKNLNALYKKGQVLDAHKLVDDIPVKKEQALKKTSGRPRPNMLNRQNFIHSKKPEDL